MAALVEHEGDSPRTGVERLCRIGGAAYRGERARTRGDERPGCPLSAPALGCEVDRRGVDPVEDRERPLGALGAGRREMGVRASEPGFEVDGFIVELAR